MRIGVFFSVFWILQDLHTFAPLRSQDFAKISQNSAKKRRSKIPGNFSKILKKRGNFCKFLTKKWVWSGTKGGFSFLDSKGTKVCKFCRSRKMLKNAPFLVIIAVHTAAPTSCGKFPPADVLRFAMTRSSSPTMALWSGRQSSRCARTVSAPTR